MTILDAAQMHERTGAHNYLKEQLHLPEYYGKNLDALYDCLTDLWETDIEFINIDNAPGSYFQKVLAVFQEAAEENRNLHLHYHI